MKLGVIGAPREQNCLLLQIATGCHNAECAIGGCPPRAPELSS